MHGDRIARAPWALLVGLGACLLYAYAAGGAAELVPRARVELALAVLALFAVAGWLYGRGGLRLRASRAGLAGLALLTGFAALAALSILWSVAPARSWTEANTVLAYALALVVGLVLGSSLGERAAQRVGIAIALATVPIALYALGGKTIPAVDVLGLSFDHAAFLNRLRAPLEYWNALALACVTALLPALRCAADPSRSPRTRVAALLGVFLFALVLGLTYSRGGLIALAAGTAVLLALTTERVRTLAFLAAAALATAPPLAVALSSPDLTTDEVPLARRTDDGAELLIVVVVAALVLAAAGRALIALERGGAFTPARGRRFGRIALAGAAAVVAAASVGVVASGAAARSFADFKDVEQSAAETDPSRLVSVNAGNRWVWWREAAGAFADRPAAGWGAGTFDITHRLYRKNFLQVQQPHSVPLQWLAEDGLIGFLLAAGALGALLAAGLARVRSLPWAPAGAPPHRGAAAALLAVAAAWIAQSFVEWSWDIPAVTLPMFAALGVLAARPAPAGEPRPIASRGPALTAAAAAFALFAVSVVLPALAESKTTAALNAASALDVTDEQLTDAAAEAELAARLNPLDIQALLDAATIATSRDRDDEARDYLLRAIGRQPYSAEVWARLAAVEFSRGDIEGLERATARAVDLDPSNPRVTIFAIRAAVAAAPPNRSATATGAPLPTDVPAPAR